VRQPKYLKRGDLVEIVNLSPCMSHFSTGIGLVEGNYQDLCGNGYADVEDNSTEHERDKQVYSVYIKGFGSSAWYPRGTLKLLKHASVDFKGIWRKLIKELER
jgi:hypothetical protein